MLGICGTTAFTSELAATKGVNDDELDARLTAAGEIAGALLGTDTGKVSGANEAEGTGGKADARFDGGKAETRFDGGKADARFDRGKAEARFDGGKTDARFDGGKADARFDGGKADARFDGGKADARFGGGIDAEVTIGELELAETEDGGNSGRVEDPFGGAGLKLGYCIGSCNEEGIGKPEGGLTNDCWAI